MDRKSNINLVPLDPQRSRVVPPADLSKEEAEAFRKLVASCHPQHFAPQDVPLIVAYVQSMLHSRRASAALSGKFAGRDTLAQWSYATKMMATLATRLRLAPQSRYDHKAAQRNANKATSGPKPWDRP
jgi:hypothetical protein